MYSCIFVSIRILVHTYMCFYLYFRIYVQSIRIVVYMHLAAGFECIHLISFHFSVIWVLFGTVFCAMLTGSMTTVLQVSLMGREISLSGTQVAVLKCGEEYHYAMKKQAVPVVYDNVSDMLRAVKQKKVAAMLLDVFDVIIKNCLQTTFENLLKVFN